MAGSDETTIDQKHISLPSYATTGGVKDYAGTAQSVTYGDDKTVYLNVELDNIPAKDYNGANRSRRIISDVTSVVTGHRNVKISVKNCEDVSENGNLYEAPAEEIYTLYNDKNYIIAVVTIGEDEGISSNWAYVNSSKVKWESYNGNTTRADNDGKWTWSREVIIDGKKTEIKYVGKTLKEIGTDDMLQGECYEIKFDADGNVRRAEALKTKIEDGDLTDGFIQDIKDAREAVTKKDNVLLHDVSLPAAIKFDEQGTLYTEDDITKGFAVSPDVKVVLALGSKLKSDGTVGLFDSVEDCTVYSGYNGLRNALKDMNVKYEKANWTNKWSLVELNAILVNNSATVIIINDKNAAPDNKPTTGGDEDLTGGKVTAAEGTAIAKGSIGGNIDTTRLGKVSLTVNFKAPEWAAKVNSANQVTFDVTIRDNVDVVETLTNSDFGTKVLDDDVYSFSGVTGVSDLENAIDKGLIDASQLKAEISNVKWTNAAVKYVYDTKTGADATAAMGTIDTNSNGSMKVDTADAGFKFTFTLPTETRQYKAPATKASYEIVGATKVDGETVATSGTIETDGAAITFSTGLKATGGDFVYVIIKDTEIKPEAPKPTPYAVEVGPNVKDTLEFAVMDNAPTASTIPADEEWSSSVTAAKDKYVLVRSAVEGVNLASAKWSEKEYGAAESNATAVGSTGVFYFQMPEKDAVITVTDNNQIDGVAYFIANDYSVVNIKTNKVATSLSTPEKKYEFAYKYLKSKGESVELVTNRDGSTAGLKVDGRDIDANDINIANNLVVATVNGVDVVSTDNNDVNTDDFLTLAGITIDNASADIFIYKDTAGTKTAIPSNDSATTVANGAVIETNGTKGYFKLSATTITAGTHTTTTGDSIDTTSNAPIMELVVNEADKLTAGADTLVKTDATLKVTLKFTAAGTVGTKDVKALIAATGATAEGTYKTAAAIAEFAAGEAFTTDTTATLEFTVDTFNGPVSVITVTLSE